MLVNLKQSTCIVFLMIVNIIASNPTADLDLSNWMKIKSDALWNKTLMELTILGTHDSGAYNLTKYFVPGAEPSWLEVAARVGEILGLPVEQVVTEWSIAQPHNLYDQMMDGVRYIDLRCGYMSRWQEWVTFHAEAGNPIEVLLHDILDFINEHDSEIVIIEASHLDGNPTEENKLWLINNFTTIFGNYLFPQQSTFPTYGDMITKNQRVLLTLDDDLASNYPQLWNGNTIENTYADSPNIDKMIEFNDIQCELYNNHSTNANSLFKISWTLTPDGDTVLETVLPKQPHSLLELASVADAQMWSWASSKFNANLMIGNIFIYDNYPNASITQILNALY